ncbi:hypothetical protein GGR88_001308 [Sphingomonas jejuensis]|uniref:Uncharacterized protein n=1 Tax=Sphingomonas jejuensis TaxID=904715 RepID=A0ABX0XM06_9SPHN|nr:hypothetical protein [Sphingomonas jejuensis]NJC33834.1 hypothetical protein [Sphingomonas jejuensis]
MIPAGFMLSDEGGRIMIVICPGVQPTAPAPEGMDMHGGMAAHHAASPGAAHHAPGKDGEKAGAPCLFSSLSAASLAAVDSLLLATLIAFVLALGWWVVLPPAPPARPYLRPPLRGPPATL